MENEMCSTLSNAALSNMFRAWRVWNEFFSEEEVHSEVGVTTLSLSVAFLKAHPYLEVSEYELETLYFEYE